MNGPDLTTTVLRIHNGKLREIPTDGLPRVMPINRGEINDKLHQIILQKGVIQGVGSKLGRYRHLQTTTIKV